MARIRDTKAVRQMVKNLLHEELSGFLSDIEFRLAQTYEVASRKAGGLQKVYAEDLNLFSHQLTGFTVTANSPSAGSIAWASAHIVYNGVDYPITDGNTALKYVWYDNAVSASVFQSSNTKPTLSGNACLVFVNNGGTPTQAIGSSMPPAVGNNAVDGAAILAGAVGAAAIANNSITATQISNTAGITGAQLSSTAGITGTQISGTAGITGAQLSTTAGITGTQLSGAANISGSQLSSTANITGTQIASNANITGAQIAAAAGITGAQLSSTANIVGSQLTAATIGSTQLGPNSVINGKIATGAVAPTNLNILTHVLY